VGNLLYIVSHCIGGMEMEFGGYILGEGNKPGDISQDKVSLMAAAQLNEKLKD
jgi:hypothetical protein